MTLANPPLQIVRETGPVHTDWIGVWSGLLSLLGQIVCTVEAQADIPPGEVSAGSVVRVVYYRLRIEAGPALHVRVYWRAGGVGTIELAICRGVPASAVPAMLQALQDAAQVEGLQLTVRPDDDGQAAEVGPDAVRLSLSRTVEMMHVSVGVLLSTRALLRSAAGMVESLDGGHGAWL